MSREDVGERAQWISNLLLTELCGRSNPYFRPRFLGDKYPTFDNIVELVDHPSCFFFVQVKGTSQGYSARKSRLKVKVSKEDIDRMVAVKVPTYVIGVDTVKKVGFLVSVNEPRGKIQTLTTAFEIDCKLLRELKDEVVKFWAVQNMNLTGSRFNE